MSGHKCTWYNVLYTAHTAPNKMKRETCGRVKKVSQYRDCFGVQSKSAKQRKDEREIAFRKNWRVRLPPRTERPAGS